MVSPYYDLEAIRKTVEAGGHRAVIGGMWDEIGRLQMDFLKASGLQRQSTLLDIGCGSLRLGVRAVEYLEAGRYWGTDINESLLESGYQKEIVPANLAAKLPRRHLIVDGDFSFSGLPREFDFAIAQSLFTHLPLNHLRLCLHHLGRHLSGGCRFFLTAFIVKDAQACEPVLHELGGITTYPGRDPYHHTVDDLRYAAKGLPWSIEDVVDWNHPRAQRMAILTLQPSRP